MAKSGSLGSLTIDIAANLTELRKDTNEVKKELNKMQRNSKKTANSMNGITKSLTGFKRLAIGIAGAVGATSALTAAVRGLGASITLFKEFESASVDLGKVTTENIGDIQERIKMLGPELGTSTELIKAYYQTISAGVTEPKKALMVVETAAKAAKAAHVDQGEVIKGLTKIMAGFGTELNSVSEASDLLFGIEKQGQTSFQELIPVIGGLSKASADLNVDTSELGGALATITQLSGDTSEAATQYQAVLTSLTKPTGAMIKALADMGFESSEAAIKQLGLSETLRKLKDSAGGSSQNMAKLFGNVRAIKGIAALSNNEFKALETNIAGVGASTGATDKAFASFQDTLEADMVKTLNEIKNLAIEIGETLAPAIRNVLQTVQSFAESLGGTLVNRAREAEKALFEMGQAGELTGEQMERLKFGLNETFRGAQVLAGEDIFGKMFNTERSKDEQRKLIELLKEFQAEAEAVQADLAGGGKDGAKNKALEEQLAFQRSLMEDQAQWEKDLIIEGVAFESEMNMARLDNFQRAEDMKKQIMASTVSNLVGFLQQMGQKSKAAAIAAIAIQKGVEIARAAQAGIVGAAMAFNSQLIPGRPESLITATAAAASVKAWTAANIALIAATGFGQASAVGSAPGGGGRSGGQDQTQEDVAGFLGASGPAAQTTIVINGVVGDADAVARAIVPAIEKALADGAR